MAERIVKTVSVQSNLEAGKIRNMARIFGLRLRGIEGNNRYSQQPQEVSLQKRTTNSQ